MRKLMWLTLGFGLACALCAYWLGKSTVLALAAFAWAVCLTIRQRRLSRLGLLAWGLAAGCSWFSVFHIWFLEPVISLDGNQKPAVIFAQDYSTPTKYGSSVSGRMEYEGKSYAVYAYLDGDQEVCPGDTISGTFRFRVTVPGGEEEATYHRGDGVFLLAYQVDEVTRTPCQNPSWREYPAVLRKEAGKLLKETFPEDTSPFAKALLLGNTEDLDYKTDTNLKISGIRHVAAVSGLHVSILFALLNFATFRKPFLTALLGFPLLLLFAATAGFTPSVNRACIMSGLMLLAQLFRKEYDGPTALSFAALCMLIVNPLVITSVGFQLSAGSVAGIYCFSPAIRKWLYDLLPKAKGWRGKLVRWFVASVSISLGALVFTTPLCAMYFGTVSLIGVVTNLLTLWMIGGIFYGILAVCLVGQIFLPGASALAKILALPIRLVLFLADILADVPLSAVYTRSCYVTAWLVFVYVLLIFFLLGKNRKPALLAGCACLGLCIALLASWAEPLLYSTGITVLDVGQGQCIVLQCKGKTFLVDCGGDSDTRTADIAAQTLLSQGISRLDGLILTHTDADHAGAVENFLSRIAADVLILPPVPIETAVSADTELLFAAENLELSFEGGKITVYRGITGEKSNENSLCVLFETENCAILITGDRGSFGEQMLLRNADMPDVDILIAGHHGSKNSTSEALLQTVRPEIVCISAGRDNPYGHPAPELLNRLEDFGCQIYRTDLQGDIIIRR